MDWTFPGRHAEIGLVDEPAVDSIRSDYESYSIETDESDRQ
jgi:hypothetical protein